MIEIAYLCSQDTLPTSPCRRSDAFEHDAMVEHLRPAFAKKNLRLEPIDWASDADWSRFSAALVGTAWDYCDQWEKFSRSLATIDAATLLLNPWEMVRWNGRKTYLQDLQSQGAKLIPTLWFDHLDPENLKSAFAQLGPDLVCKKQIGAGAIGQVRLQQDDPIPVISGAMMVQPFLPSILDEGELSFIFVDGHFCHAVRKVPKRGDYRIQSMYGGTESVYEPSTTDLRSATQIIASCKEIPFYVRVDMVRDDTHELILMELELIEPYLYPHPDCPLGEMLAAALMQRLQRSARG